MLPGSRFDVAHRANQTCATTNLPTAATAGESLKAWGPPQVAIPISHPASRTVAVLLAPKLSSLGCDRSVVKRHIGKYPHLPFLPFPRRAGQATLQQVCACCVLPDTVLCSTFLQPQTVLLLAAGRNVHRRCEQAEGAGSAEISPPIVTSTPSAGAPHPIHQTPPLRPDPSSLCCIGSPPSKALRSVCYLPYTAGQGPRLQVPGRQITKAHPFPRSFLSK